MKSALVLACIVVTGSITARGQEPTAPIMQAERHLSGIETVARDEKLKRWRAIFDLADQHPEVAAHLKRLAAARPSDLPRYQRFVVAANVAGFGMPTGIGPNSVRGSSLAAYLHDLRQVGHRSSKTWIIYSKRLSLDPKLKDLIVSFGPNAGNDLKFQEILWGIIEKYDLDFRTEPDSTFLIVPREPLG
jgi:hypothetical protein